MRVVITGTSRGIGLELTRQYLARGDSVEAGARHPEASEPLLALQRAHPDLLRLHTCDVTDDESVRAFAHSIGEVAVDLLINNAGVVGKGSLESFDPEDLVRTYRTNAVGPLLVTRALLPALRRAKGAKIVHITSGMGSIGDNTSGGAYGYRMSKAALNMASKNLSLELAPEGIISLVINPGWVKTDLGGPRATISVEESARLMIERIDAAGPAESGSFLNYRGGTFVW